MARKRAARGRRRPRGLPKHFDPFLDDTDLRQIYRLLLAAKWADFERALRNGPASWLVHTILTSEDAAIETIVFERLHAALPSARTLSLLGGARVRDAWGMLTAMDGEIADADLDALDERFQIQLTEAEETLQAAVREQPALAEPWVHLLSSGQGLGIDLQELRIRFENAHSRFPFHPDACRRYVLGLSSRGGGADPPMFDFARWVELEAPAGSPARVALPMAHLEYGLSGTSSVGLTAHLSAETTVAELAPALRSFLDATPSVARPSELGVLNAYALAMTVNGEATASLTAECFRRIDNRPTSYPWSLYEDERIVDVFAEVQRTQVRSAAKFG